MARLTLDDVILLLSARSWSCEKRFSRVVVYHVISCWFPRIRFWLALYCVGQNVVSTFPTMHTCEGVKIQNYLPSCYGIPHAVRDYGDSRSSNLGESWRVSSFLVLPGVVDFSSCLVTGPPCPSYSLLFRPCHPISSVPIIHKISQLVPTPPTGTCQFREYYHVCRLWWKNSCCEITTAETCYDTISYHEHIGNLALFSCAGTKKSLHGWRSRPR